MQRFYALVPAVLLLAFIALVALKLDSNIIERESMPVEEADLNDTQDSEKEEVEFQLKDFNQISKEEMTSNVNRKILVLYAFAIKSNFQQLNSPPPEAYSIVQSQPI